MNNITSLIFNNSKKTLSWQVYRMEDIIKQRGRYYLLNLCNDAILAIMYNGTEGTVIVYWNFHSFPTLP